MALSFDGFTVLNHYRSPLAFARHTRLLSLVPARALHILPLLAPVSRHIRPQFATILYT
jgi:hypothetical protein